MFPFIKPKSIIIYPLSNPLPVKTSFLYLPTLTTHVPPVADPGAAINDAPICVCTPVSIFNGVVLGFPLESIPVTRHNGLLSINLSFIALYCDLSFK